MSFLGFRLVLHVSLVSRVDVANRGGGELFTIVPASRAACQTVVGGRLQVLVVFPGGQNGTSWWQNSWFGGTGAGSAAAPAASSSTAAPAVLLTL